MKQARMACSQASQAMCEMEEFLPHMKLSMQNSQN